MFCTHVCHVDRSSDDEEIPAVEIHSLCHFCELGLITVIAGRRIVDDALVLVVEDAGFGTARFAANLELP